MLGGGERYNLKSIKSLTASIINKHWPIAKLVLVHDEHYQTRVQARASLFEYINVYYNRHRRHSTIGYMTPEKFEATMATMDKVA
jgi:transposase InsO family protein